MPRRKAARNVEIKPWLSARADCREGRFSLLGNSLALSAEFQALSAGARWLYLCMTLESGGKREFAFTHGAGKKYGVPATSYDRYIKELRNHGFVELVEDEEKAQYKPSTFRFTFEWKGVKPAPLIGEGEVKNIPHSGEGSTDFK